VAVIFPRWTNRIPAVIAVAAVLGVTSIVGAVWYWFSPWYTDVGYAPEQPVAFSHELHAGTLDMDCRYCHNTVEQAAMAAIPPTETCAGCHAVVRADSRKLEPVRRSFVEGTPIYKPDPNDPTTPAEFGWVRVHMLPDYAYFDHSVHVSAGVGCEECHGRIDTMERVTQAKPLSMAWCLDCHRDPYPNLRPRQEVTTMGYEATGFDSAEAYASPTTPEWGCAQNSDCPTGFCDTEANEGKGVCVGREVNPPIHCSGCHR